MTDVVRILVGPLVWLAGFSAVYGLHGLACASGWGHTDAFGMSLLRLVLGAVAIGLVGAQIAILLALSSSRLASSSGFIRRVSLATAWVGLASAIWTMLPVAVSSSCTL